MGIGLALMVLGCGRPLYQRITLPPVEPTGATPLAPAEARAAYLEAQVARARGDLEAARRWAREALRFDPDDPAVLALVAALGLEPR